MGYTLFGIGDISTLANRGGAKSRPQLSH